MTGAACVTTHHAGGGSGGSSADHQVADLAAPVLTALLIGQQGEGGLLQQGGGVRGCNTHIHKHTHTHIKITGGHTSADLFEQSELVS